MKNTKNKLNCLVNYLKLVPEERAFIIADSHKYTFGDVVKLSHDFKIQYSYLIDKNIALISEDRESLALFLPVVDSICKGVFLQPNDITTNKDDFYRYGNIEYVIRISDMDVASVESLNNNHVFSEKRYLLATSGTTGEPKLASYTLESLMATAKKDIKRGSDFIWGLSYDINRFAGLQVYLQSIASGSTLVIPNNFQTTKEMIELFITESVNSLSGTPSFWRKLLMEPTHTKIPFKRITLGGEISNQSVLSALEKSYSLARIIHIYASTEAGVGFAVKDKIEGFPVDYLSDSKKLPCDLKIKDGILWIKSVNGCSCFLKGVLDTDLDGFVNTGDKVKIENKRVIFLGRDSGSINVGGNKVMPEKVEAVLESNTNIMMAKVFAKNNPVLGSIVACEVTIKKDISYISKKELKKNILSFCRERLEVFEVPVLMKFVESIKINSTGKKVRK